MGLHPPPAEKNSALPGAEKTVHTGRRFAIIWVSEEVEGKYGTVDVHNITFCTPCSIKFGQESSKSTPQYITCQLPFTLVQNSSHENEVSLMVDLL